MESIKTGTNTVISSGVDEQPLQTARSKSPASTEGGADESLNNEFTRVSWKKANTRDRIEELMKAGVTVTTTKKDNWDKLAALSPILSGFLIFMTGSYCTYTYNQQQIKIQQCQTIEKFIPHLMGNEQSKKAAIMAISSLINTETASKFAAIFASTGTVSALQSLSQNGTAKDKSIATQALSSALQNLAEHESQLSTIEADYKKALDEKSKQSSSAGNTSINADNSYNLSRLAQLYTFKGQYGLAEPALKRALEIREKIYGPDNPEVADTLKSLAELYQLSGRTALAEAALKRARAIEQKSLVKNSAESAATMTSGPEPQTTPETVQAEAPTKSEPETVEGQSSQNAGTKN